MKIGFRVVLLFVFVTVFASSVTFAQSSSDRTALLKEIESLRDKLKTNEEAFLSPTSQDLAAYAEFLGQPNTGLISLLPREEYDEKNKLTIRGGGAFYSFTRLTHEYGYGSDIMLSTGQLSVGFAGADYGAIVRIGNVPLNDLNLEDPRVRFLSAYEPPSDEPQARSEARRFAYGVKEGDIVYKRDAPIEANATYVLRSIAYDRYDILVGLSVVRRDPDGSAIIAWKLLRTYAAPQLVRAR